MTKRQRGAPPTRWTQPRQGLRAGGAAGSPLPSPPPPRLPMGLRQPEPSAGDTRESNLEPDQEQWGAEGCGKGHSVPTDQGPAVWLGGRCPEGQGPLEVRGAAGKAWGVQAQAPDL